MLQRFWFLETIGNGLFCVQRFSSPLTNAINSQTRTEMFTHSQVNPRTSLCMTIVSAKSRQLNFRKQTLISQLMSINYCSLHLICFKCYRPSIKKCVICAQLSTKPQTARHQHNSQLFLFWDNFYWNKTACCWTEVTYLYIIDRISIFGLLSSGNGGEKSGDI